MGPKIFIDTATHSIYKSTLRRRCLPCVDLAGTCRCTTEALDAGEFHALSARMAHRQTDRCPLYGDNIHDRLRFNDYFLSTYGPTDWP